MNSEFMTRFLMGIALGAVFAVPFIWAGISDGYFARLTQTGLVLHGIGIAAIVIALAAAIATIMTWQAERDASTQSDRSRPRT